MMWDWQGDEFSLQDAINLDIPKSQWNDVSENEDMSYIFGEITPINACGDVGYHPTNSERTKNVKAGKPCASQIKRRRMLQFDSEVVEIAYCNEELPPTFLKSKDGEATLEEAFSNMSHLAGEDTSSSGHEGFDYTPAEQEASKVQRRRSRPRKNVVFKDINQRICTPPKPKPVEEDPSAAYPTSAFSGKPVVAKTKIHTEGGKGCITIMRTKG